MNVTRTAGWLAGAMTCIALAACSGAEEGGDDSAINTAPSSLAEANAEMDKIDRIIAEGGSTPALLETQRLVRDRLDVYSGLVDRLEVSPGHSLDIFAAPNGLIVLSERMKVGDLSVMKNDAPESVPAIYARLAPGRVIPAAITNARSVQTSGITAGPSPQGDLSDSDQAVGADGAASVQSAITDSAADGLWFVANHCNFTPSGSIVYRGACVIDKVGNRHSQATSDHAQARVAFTVGNGSIFLRVRSSTTAPEPWFEWRILRGEVLQAWVVGGWKEVPNSGCIPLIACQSHREAQRMFSRFTIEGASGKKYDMSTVFYNDPHNWNGP